MARVTVEDCLDKVDNRFALVLLVAKRAKQLLKGSHATVAARNNKYIVTSLREVAAGSVYFEGGMGNADARRSEIERDLNR
jgi:DNA-directed RNA polymerase subunit omega